MDILTRETASKEQLSIWVRTKNPNPLAIELLDLYWTIALEYGVNPIVVYCQSMKETGYLKFGGVLDETFKNPCGLKIPQGGACDNPNAHKRFNSWTLGITAQCEHLALYAGKEQYPLKEPLDPRHFSYLHGKCKTVESLSNNWAGSNYGESIVKMCDEVTNVILDKNEIEKLKEELNAVNEKLNKIKAIV